MRNYLGFCFLAVLVGQTLCAPLTKTDHVTPKSEGTTDQDTTKEVPSGGITDKDGAAEYLKKYGYFRPGISKNSNSDRDEFKESIKWMQKFFNLNVTGDLDNETLAVMNSKRCPLPDVIPGSNGRQKRFLAIRKWPWKYLTYKVLNYPSTTMSFNNRAEMDTAVDEGFKIWSKYAKIFMTRTTSNLADMKMGFYKGYHGDDGVFNPNNGVLAHAFYPKDGRIHFNDYYTWSKYDNYNLRQVTAHEVGHAIGLGHSSDRSAIMYPIIYYKTNFNLANDDVRGIQYLYGKP